MKPNVKIIDLSGSQTPIKPNLGFEYHSLFKYSSFELYERLANSIASWLQIPFGHIVFGNGVSEFIELITSLIKDNPVCIFSPCFYQYENFAHKHNLEVNLLEWKWQDIPYEKISKASIIWIANPNNPTDHKMDKKIIDSIINYSKGYVVIDESFADFTEESLCKEYYDHNRVFLIRSFSKSFGLCGCRIGYLVSSTQNINLIKSIKDPLSANRIGISQALNMIDNHLQEYQKIWKESTKIKESILKVLQYGQYQILKGESPYISILFNNHQEATKFNNLAMDQGLKLKPGWDWEFSGSSNCIIRIGLPPTELIEEVKSRLSSLK